MTLEELAHVIMGLTTQAGFAITVFKIKFLGAFILFFKHLCVWLHWVLVTACELFSCSVWDLVLHQGFEPGPLHWEQVLALDQQEVPVPYRLK